MLSKPIDFWQLLASLLIVLAYDRLKVFWIKRRQPREDLSTSQKRIEAAEDLLKDYWTHPRQPIDDGPRLRREYGNACCLHPREGRDFHYRLDPIDGSAMCRCAIVNGFFTDQPFDVKAWYLVRGLGLPPLIDPTFVAYSCDIEPVQLRLERTTEGGHDAP